jgi:hypothetical protein
VRLQDLGDAIRKYDANLPRPNELVDIVLPGAPEGSKRPTKNNILLWLLGPAFPAGDRRGGKTARQRVENSVQ